MPPKFQTPFSTRFPAPGRESGTVELLQNVQRPDETWLPLWFGHQFNEDDENPVCGTSRVVRAMSTMGEEYSDSCQKAVGLAFGQQNGGGGGSARSGLESSVEASGLAVRVNEGTVNRPLRSASILPDSGILKIFTQSCSRQRG